MYNRTHYNRQSYNRKSRSEFEWTGTATAESRASGSLLIERHLTGNVAEAVAEAFGEIIRRHLFEGVAEAASEAAGALVRVRFFSGTAVAEANGRVEGLYILHPNNIGRAGHIANASYAVAPSARGSGIGEALVRHSLTQLRPHGFTGLQFNAVVSTNMHARHLYERLGFIQLGTIKNGFRKKDGSYEDICPYYITL